MSLDKPPLTFKGWSASWMPHGSHFTAMIGGFWYTAIKYGNHWQIESVENNAFWYI